MKLALALVLGVLVAGCAEDDGARHLPDASAVDAASNVELVITKAGNGTGLVSSSPTGLSCGDNCTNTFAPHTTVVLTAEPDSSSTFGGWSGACSGDASTCEVTLEAATHVTATFSLTRHTVTLAKSGPGGGTLHGGGIDCTSNCTLEVDHGTALTFTQTPGALAVFGGWGGACTGMTTCEVTVTDDIMITGNFALSNFTLFAVKTGNGSGTVTSTPAGINCGNDCNEVYTANQMVTLTASPATGSRFEGWTGNGCSGTAPCVVTVTGPKTLTAQFALNQYALSVTKTGQGTISGMGIDCGTDCSESYDYGSTVTLTAAPATGYSFTGWGGACSGTGPCTVAINAAKSVTATFTINTYALTVTKTGSGTITGTGIACGTDCTETYNYNTPVTLTAAPATGYTFTGWGGACSGTGPCSVTMNAAKSVTATFTLQTFTLTVTKTGSGTITGTGIACGTDCTETYNYNTPVTLTAAPATGYTFTGWGGACSGTGPCSVTMTAAKSVTATFVVQTFALTVSTTGLGTVTASGINCGSDCSETYPYNTPVALTATPAAGYVFTSWGGACSGAGACSVTMTGARAVTATFTRLVMLSIGRTGDGAGTVTGPGINCAAPCSVSLPAGTPVTLSATGGTTPATASTFTGWSGACIGTTTCALTLNADTSVAAGFKLKPNIMFVTSKTYTGDLGGLDGADAKCNEAAAAANLSGKYVAYLSSIEGQQLVNAPSRVGNATGWVRVDGAAVMNNVEQMHSSVFNAPSRMENGVDVSQTQVNTAWTGTSRQGTWHSSCEPAGAFAPWRGTAGRAMYGLATDTGILVGAADDVDCTLQRRLYCLGVDRHAVAQ